MVTGNFFPAKAAGQKSNLGYSPIVARTGSTHRTSELAAFDCIRVIVIRDGSAFLDGEFGTESVTVGHIVVLGADVYCRTEPEGHVTSTVIYIDPDYLADQMFWQYSHVLQDRLDAKELFATLYAEKSQVLKLGEERVGMLMPWLDEMTMLSAEDSSREHFLRMQALWFSVADAITPYIRVSSNPLSPNQQAQSRPTLPRGRKFTPMRDEALTIHTALLDVAGHDVVYTQRRLGWVLPVATGRQVRGSSHERAWVGSEVSGFQEPAGDVVSEAAEAQSRGTEMLMATIDRLGRPVARAWTIEVGQGVDSSTLEGLSETGELRQFPISSARRSPRAEGSASRTGRPSRPLP